MKRLIQIVENFVFPLRYLNDPEYHVSRNLLPWDLMVRSIA